MMMGCESVVEGIETKCGDEDDDDDGSEDAATGSDTCAGTIAMAELSD